MTQVALLPPDPTGSTVKDIISILLLILGIIIVSVGSFILWGIGGMLMTIGVSLIVISLILGWDK